MYLRNALKLILSIVFVIAACGCDLKALKALQRQSINTDNSVDISDSTVIINIVTNPTAGGGGTGSGVRYNDGTFQVSTTQSTLPGDLHFRGTNHTSFLPPTAPSAVGNPF